MDAAYRAETDRVASDSEVSAFIARLGDTMRELEAALQESPRLSDSPVPDDLTA